MWATRCGRRDGGDAIGTTRSESTTSTTSNRSGHLQSLERINSGVATTLIHGNFEPIDEAWLPQVTFALTQILTTKALLVPGYLVIAKVQNRSRLSQ